jgi:hypothetical protein
MTDNQKVLGLIQLTYDTAVILPLEEALSLFKLLATTTFVSIDYKGKINSILTPDEHKYPQLNIVSSTIIEETKIEQAITP